MTIISASSDTVTIAAPIELIRCATGNSETPFVTLIEKRTEVVVMTSYPVILDLLRMIWHNVMQQWSRSGFEELPSKDFDAYGHILRVCYVLQGGSRERYHDIFHYNLDRTLEFLKSGTTSNIYLQFYFWPSRDQKSETTSPPPLPWEDCDRNDEQIETSHTSERQIETTPENQDVEEDEVESQPLDQEAHCPDCPDYPEDPRIDSAASSPVHGNMVRKNSTSKALRRSPRTLDLRPCDMVESY